MTQRGRVRQPATFGSQTNARTVDGDYIGGSDDRDLDIYATPSGFQLRHDMVGEIEQTLHNIESKVTKIDTLEEKLESVRGLLQMLINKLNNAELFGSELQASEIDLDEIAKVWNETSHLDE